MTRGVRLAPAALAVAAFAVTGCGGDDETTTADTGPTGAGGATLTAEAFAQQANAICSAGNQSIAKAANSTFTGQKPSARQLQQYADLAVPAIQTQIDAIRVLPAPEDLQDDVADFLDTAESDLKKVKADPSLFAAGDTDPFANTNQAASKLGLDECGSSG
jgi:hypothetical protein